MNKHQRARNGFIRKRERFQRLKWCPFGAAAVICFTRLDLPFSKVENVDAPISLIYISVFFLCYSFYIRNGRIIWSYQMKLFILKTSNLSFRYLRFRTLSASNTAMRFHENNSTTSFKVSRLHQLISAFLIVFFPPIAPLPSRERAPSNRKVSNL